MNKRIRLSSHQKKCVSKITCLGENLLTVTFLYKSVKVCTSANAYIIAVYFMKPWNYNIRLNVLRFHDETK